MASDEQRQTEAGQQTEDETRSAPPATGRSNAGDRASLDKTAVVKLQAAQADVRMSAVGLLSTESAQLKMSPAALTYARGPVELKLSSANMLVTGGDVNVQYGGAQLLAAGGDARLATAAAGAVIAREVHVERGLVGMLVARDAELADGARVILRPSGAAALGAGFAGGLLLAVAFLWRLLAGGLKRSDDD
ncbi:MAG: hypothetical protein FJ000_02260 [Actinobacteria bacterium]|nr:hypothetical protein [Actinomycetota bacterium]